MADGPWSSGPREILEHGLSLLRHDSDKHRRLAMITIDNAVELMMKTFLGLPKRVTNLSINRSRYAEFSQSFPKLLDAMEEFASDKLTGIRLGELEWYHRLRNQLYHDGNGLTVERKKVEVYATLATVLFENLFGSTLALPKSSQATLLSAFLRAWADLENALSTWFRHYEGSVMGSVRTPRQLARKGIIDKPTAQEIEELGAVRNEWVHSSDKPESDTPEIRQAMIERTESIAGMLRKKLIDLTQQ
jgi:hypothetical protein